MNGDVSRGLGIGCEPARGYFGPRRKWMAQVDTGQCTSGKGIVH
jgi:hypothetical protein